MLIQRITSITVTFIAVALVTLGFCQGIMPDSNTNSSCSYNFNSTTTPVAKTPSLSSENIMKRTLVVVLASDMMDYIREKAVTEQAISNCKNLNGSYIESTQSCVRYEKAKNGSGNCLDVIHIKKNRFLLEINKRQQVEYAIHLVGNSFSIISLLLLLVTYLLNSKLHTSYGRSVMLLSLNTLLLQVLQILSLEAKGIGQLCLALAVVQHWSYLVMFTWMASIAFDISVTFSRVRKPSTTTQMRRFKFYTVLSQSAPTILVASCSALDFSSGANLIGYGKNNICFITNFMANILAFSLPVASIILFNIICLLITLVFIGRARQYSRSILGSKRTRRQEAITFVIMTLKLSFLLGIGWIFGPIGRITRSIHVMYVYTFFSSFQGVFIFIAFCFNERVIQFYKSKFAKIAPRLERLQVGAQAQETCV